MYKKMLLGLILAGVSCSILADTLELTEDYPERYVVEKGDTLWDISGQYLEQPWRWPELWQVNPQIANPHLIYPGDVLTLTWQDGRPLLQVNADGTRTRYQKLSPSVREIARGQEAVPPIPLDAIQQFLSRPRIVSEATLADAPYVVSSEDQHLVNGSNGRIYVRGFEDEIRPSYAIYRGGEAYRDPDEGNRVVGYQALYVGHAMVERSGDPATARIIKSEREVLNGDRLLPETDYEYPSFVPRAPAGEVSV